MNAETNVDTELNNQGKPQGLRQKPGFHHRRHLNEPCESIMSERYSGRKEKSEPIYFLLFEGAQTY